MIDKKHETQMINLKNYLLEVLPDNISMSIESLGIDSDGKGKLEARILVEADEFTVAQNSVREQVCKDLEEALRARGGSDGWTKQEIDFVQSVITSL